jgi:hypothetical protein
MAKRLTVQRSVPVNLVIPRAEAEILRFIAIVKILLRLGQDLRMIRSDGGRHAKIPDTGYSIPVEAKRRSREAGINVFCPFYKKKERSDSLIQYPESWIQHLTVLKSKFTMGDKR